MAFIIIYLFTYAVVLFIRKKNIIKWKPFPKMFLKKNGIVFKSHARHKLMIGESKYLQIGKKIYIKTKRGVVTISNVDHSYFSHGFLYFVGLGIINISLDCGEIYRYFNIEIVSNKFTINCLKQAAIIDFLNNQFGNGLYKIFNKYINIIKNVLNINISEKKLIIKQNQFRFPYTIKYKLNNTIKIVNVNQTLEEFSNI